MMMHWHRFNETWPSEQSQSLLIYQPFFFLSFPSGTCSAGVAAAAAVTSSTNLMPPARICGASVGTHSTYRHFKVSGGCGEATR